MLMLLLLLPLLFLSLPSHSQAQLCHRYDTAALLSFKNSFPNPNSLPSWTLNSIAATGTESNATTPPTASSALTYPPLISTAQSRLPSPNSNSLRHLRLLKLPNLLGPIPPEIEQLPLLGYLVISWTNISGPIPKFLTNLKNLSYLIHSFNRLSGPIPPSLQSLPYLYAIDLSRNLLTGPIPESFGHFPHTTPAVDLSHNMLSGDIPASLANVNFSRIELSRNNLSGDASVFFGKDKAASIIDISRNGFEFDFTKVVFMEALDVLDISHNKVHGGIPQQIQRLRICSF